MAAFIEMRVVGIALDPSNNAPIVILQDLEGKMMLPIWIGIMEASSIAAAIEGIAYSRPMTHDLLKSVVETFEARVLKVEIVDIKNNVFYALITFEQAGRLFQVDARPSDAIALAIRVKANIFVASHVARDASHVESDGENKNPIVVGFEQDQDKLKRILEEMDPDDFGKFKA